VTTKQRIKLLAPFFQSQHSDFTEFLGTCRQDDIEQWVELELGSLDALDTFRQHGSILSKAVAPKNILHIVSGNTPHGALQSITRGLLIGAHNRIKLPSTGLPEVDAFQRALPTELQNLLECHSIIPEFWWEEADVIIAIGSDSTISAVQQRVSPHQRFLPHGHKISCALIERPSTVAAQLAAEDTIAFNQLGCLSPHAVYLKHGALEFASMLAKELENLEQRTPRGPISLSESGAISNLRETIRYRASNTSDTQLWESSKSTAWTVIYEQDPTLTPSCLNRTIYVKPWPSNPAKLGPELNHISSLSLYPMDQSMLQTAETITPPRICPLGKIQQPSIFWHHDGIAPLASLVTWRDIEPTH